MKKILYVLFLISTIANCQISVTKAAEPVIIKTIDYDSINNFLGKDYSNYIGQDLFLRPLNEGLRKYGYDNFKLDPKGSSYSSKNVYKKDENSESNYEELQGKLFNVLDVLEDPSSSFSKNAFLKLKFKDNDETVFFKYDTQYSHNFPFTVMGYFEKSKQIFIGNEVLIRKFKTEGSTPISDINTGEVLDISTDKYYKCVDITLDEKYFSLALVLETETKQKFIFFLSNRTNNIPRILLKNEAESYKVKFGDIYWEAILKEEVKVGFTEEMTKLSWGEPDSINSSSYGDQWVYTGTYLYFENGLLKSFN